MHPHLMYQLGKDLHRDLIGEAERARMGKRERTGPRGAIRRFQERLGDLLVKTGQRLQRPDARQQVGTLRWAQE